MLYFKFLGDHLSLEGSVLLSYLDFQLGVNLARIQFPA